MGAWNRTARRGRREILQAVALAFALACALAAPAEAADRAIDFRLQGVPLKAELIELAAQAQVSIRLHRPERCAAPGRDLSGRFTVEAALKRLLTGGGGSWRRLAPDAFEVTCGAAPARPAASRRPTATPPADAPELTPLVVVATRRATPADRLAYSVSVVAQPALTSQGVRDLADLAQLTPSMTVTNLGMGRDKILLRGLSDGPLTGRAQSMVGLYLDGVRLTYNAPDPDLRLVDMQRVEVLRGPQGAIYGAGSLGGVVHFVTAAPDPSRFEGWISATGAATEAAGDSHAVDAVVNVPLLRGRAAVRLVAYDEFEGGYIKDRSLRLDDVNRSDRTGARLTFGADLAAGWTLTAGVVAQAINTKDTQYALVGAPAYTRANQLREPHDNDFSEVHLQLRGDLGAAELEWSAAYIGHGLYSRYDASAAPPVPLPPGPAAFDDHNEISTLLSEAAFTSHASARIQWTAGLFLARSFQNTDSNLTSLGAAPLIALSERRKDRLDEAAIFGEATFPLLFSIDATIGGRLFTSNNTVSSQDAAPLAGGASTFNDRVGRSGFAPKLVLAYRAAPDWMVYVQAAEGYRAGGFNTLGPPGQVFGEVSGRQPYREYGGDELWSFEAGGKLSLLSNRLRLRGALFQALWKNIQSDLLRPSGLPFTANLGDGSNQGVEFEGAYRSPAGLELNAQLVLNRPELDRANPSFPSKPEFGLAVVPNVSAGVSARRVWPLSQGRAFELDGRAAYVGGSRLVLDASTAPKMGDYVTGRIAAAFVDRSWRWTLAVDNPLGSRADTFAFGNPFSVRTAPQTTPLRPRTISISLRRDF